MIWLKLLFEYHIFEMASSRYHSFLKLMVFYTFLQNNISNGGAENQCLNPTFKSDQKIVVDFYYSATDSIWPDPDLCEIILDSNGLMSMVYRMSSDMADKENCSQSEDCMRNRRMACNYKFYQSSYNDCTKELPPLSKKVTDCMEKGEADDILINNDTARKKLGINTSPALVVDNKYDPCFTDYSLDGMKAYFCKGFQNGIPICKK